MDGAERPAPDALVLLPLFRKDMLVCFPRGKAYFSASGTLVDFHGSSFFISFAPANHFSNALSDFLKLQEINALHSVFKLYLTHSLFKSHVTHSICAVLFTASYLVPLMIIDTSLINS